MVSTPLRDRLSAMRAELGRSSPEPVVDRPRPVDPTGILPEGDGLALQRPDRIDAVALLGELLGKTITTLTGKPNRIIALSDAMVTVATGKSPGGESVPVAWVQSALDRLIRDRAIDIDVETVGYRSAFVGAVLAAVPGATFSVRPRRVCL
jgi:hypothetical protein